MTDYECSYFLATPVCCGAYNNYSRADICYFSEMARPDVRARIIELAKDFDILVPTCNGSYVPATIAFRGTNEDNNGGGL